MRFSSGVAYSKAGYATANDEDALLGYIGSRLSCLSTVKYKLIAEASEEEVWCRGDRHGDK